MEPLQQLLKGLDILRPFLSNYGFAFDHYENGKGSGGQFTIASFKKENKRFVISYRYSVGDVVYQCNDLWVSHSFYLDGLGYAEQKQFPDFQCDDKLLAFRHILHDFQFLVDDFFAGDGAQLKALSWQEKKKLEELYRQAEEVSKYAGDQSAIKAARLHFKNKEYGKSFAAYEMVKHAELLTDFDERAIEYCRKQVQ